MQKVFKIPIFFFCLFLWMSCGKDEIDINAVNQEDIEQYIAINNLNALSTGSGLYYVIEEQGNGEFPTVNSTVTVHYRGYLTNDAEFDSSYSRGEPLTISLRQVIEGWQEGIPLFSKGGKGKLLIPSKLGYGVNPPTALIPNHSVLIFDVELIDFQ